MRYLTFALAKGRLAKKTLAMFEQMGITCEEAKDPDTRKLIFTNEEHKIRFFLAKASDVPTYVEYGAADIGVVGRIRSWRKAVTCMRLWILVLAGAGCAFADRHLLGNCFPKMKLSV